MPEVPYLPVLAEGFPRAPDPALDAYLDATEICIVRHGLSRTALGDIAKQLGVSRTTVHRQLGSVENAVRLIAARELHRFQETVPAALADAAGPEGVVRVLAAIIALARENPVVAKILRDEPEVVGGWLATESADAFALVAEMLRPTLEVAITAGIIRRHDPRALAHWITRMSATLIVAPPPGDITKLLGDMLLPILEPESRRARPLRAARQAR